MIYKFIFFLMSLISVYSLIPNPIVSYNNKIGDLESIKVMEPKNLVHPDSSCLVFFTGGSSIIFPDIYSNFLNKLANKNISIYTHSFNYKNVGELINELNKDYKEVILAGHSSGCSLALKNSNNENLKKLILFDPVKTDLLNQDLYELRNLNSILFLNAMKSYKFNLFPPAIPFVPEFVSIKKDDLDLNDDCDIITCKAMAYGHCDILNKEFSDKMHEARIAIGNKNREQENLDKYQDWLVTSVDSYLNNKNIKKKKY